jgi:hypothetical protein
MNDELPRPIIKIDPANVPAELHFLTPLAEKWGISDYKVRDVLLKQASLAELEELNKVDAEILNAIIKATYFPPLEDTPEATIFVDLIKANAQAIGLLQEQRRKSQPSAKPASVRVDDDDGEIFDKSWLKSMGWPEEYPPVQVDPTKFPEDLQIIIPLIEKWVIMEPLVRDVRLREAPTEELQEFVNVINKAGGYDKLLTRVVKMGYAETSGHEAYLAMLMLSLAEDAEILLQTRRDAAQ